MTSSRMSFFSKLYKSQEEARERNKREQRRSDSFKFGPDYIERYHLAALERERRLVQREFERIRKEIQDEPPLFDFSSSPVISPQVKSKTLGDTHAQHSIERRDDVDGKSEYDSKNSKDSIESRKEEIGLYDTILFFRNNPAVLVPILTIHGKKEEYVSDASSQTVTEEVPEDTVDAKDVPTERKVQSLPNEDSESFVPFYLRSDYNPSFGEIKTETFKKYAILLRQHTPPGYTRGKHGALQRKNRHQLDLLTLARGGMQSARDTITARLGGSEGDVNHGEAEGHDRADSVRPKMTKANVPTYQNFDAERYNADGSLRTCHNLPPSDEAWAEARKANYIRHKDKPTNQSQLNIQEIFAKD